MVYTKYFGVVRAREIQEKGSLAWYFTVLTCVSEEYTGSKSRWTRGKYKCVWMLAQYLHGWPTINTAVLKHLKLKPQLC